MADDQSRVASFNLLAVGQKSVLAGGGAFRTGQDAAGVLLARAHDVALRVVVRAVVGDVGSNVYLAFNTNALTGNPLPAGFLGGIITDTFFLPVGEKEEFWLEPGQNLYAIGSIAGMQVTVSISNLEVPRRVQQLGSR